MPGTEISFAEYAQAFYEIFFYDSKPSKALFMKEFLIIGLNDYQKETINDIFPTIINDNGKRIIEKNKADRLRKYLRGENGISDLVSEIGYKFDSEFKRRYIDELQEFDESKLIKFARRYQLEVDEDDVDNVSEAIAELYVSIIKNVSTRKRSKPIISEDNLNLDKNSIVLSYTFTEPEKQALINICGLLKDTLKGIKSLSRTISDKQHELTKLNDSEKDNRWKKYLEAEISSYVKQFDKAFAKLEQLCADLCALLELKQDMDEEYPKLISFSNNISNSKYRLMCRDGYDYDALWRLISQIDKSIDNVLSTIDKG
ncbi:hypothetical protein SAMN02910353_01635 [Ruminococcus sp. YRD2003]|uniref:hypothetical protein n=1 Tax=Ruminococcus sp. YRD2003 TaxID=1452313 RepID=UPI0008CD01A2|nr:hypothetical protein SAMN02910353_01635 [Ruminococcus flavefaciens]